MTFSWDLGYMIGEPGDFFTRHDPEGVLRGDGGVILNVYPPGTATNELNRVIYDVRWNSDGRIRPCMGDESDIIIG